MLLGTELESKRTIQVPDITREQGFYILGRRGMGKSTLLEAMISQDIYNGSGVGVFDPHGSLIDAVITRVPESRIHDVMYLDAADRAYAFGLNLFDLGEERSQAELSRAVDQVVQAFKKVWGVGEDASWGPLLEDLLANITHTLMESQGYTLAEIPALLYKSAFRKRLVQALENWVVRDFWEYDWDPLRNDQQIRDRRSTTNKVRAFLRDPVLLHILGQATTTVPFRAIMDHQKILLVKLPLGEIGETAVSLLGSLMIGQILTAAMSREASSETPMFYLYCDEFQRFATPAFATLIDETRKYRVSTTIAHQRLDQLDFAYRNAAMGSVNFALFQVMGDDAEELVTQFDIRAPELEPDANQWEQVKRGLHPNPAMANHLANLDRVLDQIRRFVEWVSGVRFDRTAYADRHITYYTEDIDYHAVSRVMHWLDDRISQYYAQSLPVGDIHQAMQLREPLFAELVTQLNSLYQVDRQTPPPYKEVAEDLDARKALRLAYFKDELLAALARIYFGIQNEPVRTGHRRTVADTRAEFANTLATLDPRTIAVRFWDGTRYQQGVVRMPQIAPGVENPEKAQRITAISHEWYSRPRSEIDAEIRARREALEEEPNEPDPVLEAERPPSLPIRERKRT